MPHPKRKLSRARRDSRRGHDKAVASTLGTCSNCGAPTLYHRICNECGYYKGKLAIEKKASA
jgi:large subunit ribosomal protein L32